MLERCRVAATASIMSRFVPYLLSVAASVVFAVALLAQSAWGWGLVVAVPLAMIGTRDLLQSRHTLMRNYPVVGRLRWLLEAIRPQIQQYFINDDLHGAPFNREQRSLVYARSKGQNDFEPFGTEADVRAVGFEWINHSIAPADVGPAPRVEIGAGRCAKPYSSSLLNISAMSFGALSGNAIRALNRGARAGRFAHDTGEGGISVHHRQGGDLIWELGTGYFGCRTRDGRFDAAQFADQAADPDVRMIEIKLSQGAKAGHGGILPAAKVTAEIAAARGVTAGEDCVSPSRHTAFRSPIELLEFATRLRELSSGKPVGIKLCIGYPSEFLAICKAMLRTDVLLDFVVVDGKEGGTGAAPEEFSDNVGTPLREGLLFVRNALEGCGLADKVRVGASGKIVSGFDMARCLALGADWCNAARPFMFALGCVQSRRCHTDRCPTGVATQDALRQRGLVVDDKSQRVARFHEQTIESLMALVAAAGLPAPAALGPEHVFRRTSDIETRPLTSLYTFLQRDELLDGARDAWYREQWDQARAESFSPTSHRVD
jgi:glutamate synthase domain-containing protein 2